MERNDHTKLWALHKATKLVLFLGGPGDLSFYQSDNKCFSGGYQLHLEA